MRFTRDGRILVGLALAHAACGSEEASRDPIPTSSDGPAPLDLAVAYHPEISATDLSPDITNPWFLAPVGARWQYEAETEDGLERIEIEVLAETREVWATTARVVRDTVYLDGEMIEDTHDWYAQDGAGNVWYLGEDTHEYEDGMEVCACGAWESGYDGALPGVVMLGVPKAGAAYRQEYYAGEAEDFAEVISVNETVDVAAGRFTGCLKTRDRSVLDPEIDEFKYYCPAVGNVLVEEGNVRVELVTFSGL
jgi:hypothetical protein